MASRPGDEGLDPGRIGAEKLREPRLPLDAPPPARAQASNVHTNVANNIAIRAVKNTDRCIALSSSPLLTLTLSASSGNLSAELLHTLSGSGGLDRAVLALGRTPHHRHGYERLRLEARIAPIISVGCALAL